MAKYLITENWATLFPLFLAGLCRAERDAGSNRNLAVTLYQFRSSSIV